MPASSGGNDFFLSFSSNAQEFSESLEANIQPSILNIHELQDALTTYEETLKRIKTGDSPLGLSFKGLDDAAAKMQASADSLVRGFGASMDRLEAQIIGLSEIMRTAQGGLRVGSEGVGEGGSLNGHHEPDPAVVGANGKIKDAKTKEAKVVADGVAVEEETNRKKRSAAQRSMQASEQIAAAERGIASAGGLLATRLEELASRIGRVSVPDGDGPPLNGNGRAGGHVAEPAAAPPSEPVPVKVVTDQVNVPPVAPPPETVDPEQNAAAGRRRFADLKPPTQARYLEKGYTPDDYDAGRVDSAYVNGRKKTPDADKAPLPPRPSDTPPSESTGAETEPGSARAVADRRAGVTVKVPGLHSRTSYNKDVEGAEDLAREYLDKITTIDDLHGEAGTAPHPPLHRLKLREAAAEFDQKRYALLAGEPNEEGESEFVLDPARVARQKANLASIRDQIGREQAIDLPAYIARDAAHAAELRDVQASTDPGSQLRRARLQEVGAKSAVTAVEGDSGATESERAEAELKLSEAMALVADAEAKVAQATALADADRRRATKTEEAYAAGSERVTSTLLKEAEAEYKLAEIRIKGGTGTAKEATAKGELDGARDNFMLATELDANAKWQRERFERIYDPTADETPTNVRKAQVEAARAERRKFDAILDPDPEALGTADIAHQVASDNLRKVGARAAVDQTLHPRIQEIFANTNAGPVQKALVDEALAQAKLNELQLSGVASADALAAAQIRLATASRTADDAIKVDGKAQGAGGGEGLLASFGLGVGKSGGYALRHLIGFSLVFSGFEKLKEVVDTGLEAQAEFVRLNAELKATGKTSDGVAESLQGISNKTATPLGKVIAAASELTGVFGPGAKGSQDVVTATGVASGLSLLSQGEITPDQSAIGLRNTIGAFNFTANDTVKFADTVAHLGQTTGVNVADIQEGATTLAQEAADFGLGPRQAAAISAYVTQNTGEKGDAAAEQTSRLLSTFYNSKVQSVLIRNGVATEAQFQEPGKISDVLANLVTKYESLNPATKQELASVIGSGRQARVFAALTSGGEDFAKVLKGEQAPGEAGAFKRQQDAYLATVEGQIHQLGVDFRNIGDSLRRVGVFDAIGILAKGLDQLARSFTFIINKLDEVEHILGPVGEGVGHLLVMLAEAAAAGKLLKGLGLTTGISNLAGRLTGGRLGTAPGSAASVTGMAAFNRQLAAADVALDLFTRNLGIATVAAAGAPAVGTAEAGLAGAAAGGAAPAVGTAEAGLAGAAAGGAAPAAVARRSLLGRLFGGAGGAAAAGAGGAAAAGAGGSAAGAAGAGAVAGAGFLEGIGGLGLLSSAGLVAAAGAATLSFMIPGALAAQRKDKADKAAGSGALAILADTGATGQDSLDAVNQFGTEVDKRPSRMQHASQAGLNAAVSVVSLGLDQHQFGEAPSDGASNESFKLAGIFTHRANSKLSKAIATKNVAKIVEAYKEINDDVAQYGEKIAKAGGNDGVGQTQIAQILESARVGLKEMADRATKKFQGIADLDVALSQTQADLLGVYTSSVGSLSSEELARNPGATRALLENSGTIIGTKANDIATNLAGLKYTPPTAKETAKYNSDESAYQAGVRAWQGYQELMQEEYKKEQDHNKDSPSYVAKPFKTATGTIQYKRVPGPKFTDKNGIVADPITGELSDPNHVLNVGNIERPGAAPTAADGHYTQLDDLTPLQKAKDIVALDQRRIDAYTSVIDGIDPLDGKHRGQFLNPDAKDGKFDKDPTKNAAKARAYTAEQKQTAAQSLASAEQEQQTQQQAVYTIPIQNAANTAQVQEGVGNFTGAAASLQKQITGLTNYNRSLSIGDPQFVANIQTIEALRTQIVQELSTSKIGALQITASNSNAPIAAAHAAHEIALQHVRDAEKAYEDLVQGALELVEKDEKEIAAVIDRMGAAAQGSALYKKLEKQAKHDETTLKLLRASGGNTKAKMAADAEAASTAASEASANEARDEAQAQSHIAGLRNSKQIASAQLAEALRQEAYYRKQNNPAAAAGAVTQEKQARIAMADATEAEKESALKAAGAYAVFKGDAVGGAKDNLAAAQKAYAYAVAQFGKGSQQANDALVNQYQAQQAVIDAELQKQNAALELDIARLNARGQQGDAQKAAQDQVREAQNNLNSYLKKGGKKSGAQYDQLKGAIATAHRNAFDVALNAQLDTLDFQRETYKITSSQEVRSLQQILKNKQLTLAEQRAITLKIKDLQQSIREQLTQGGLNIPSDIKLPTAYQVRRSLGAGFGGSATQVNTVTTNNNQQVVVNNNVPNAQIAAQIANQVIQVINQQTGQHIRANSATPRLVGTR